MGPVLPQPSRLPELTVQVAWISVGLFDRSPMGCEAGMLVYEVRLFLPSRSLFSSFDTLSLSSYFSCAFFQLAPLRHGIFDEN